MLILDHLILEIFCHAKAKPINGDGPDQLTVYLPDQQISYSCNDGYEIVGDETVICLSSGTWSSFPPSCKG